MGQYIFNDSVILEHVTEKCCLRTRHSYYLPAPVSSCPGLPACLSAEATLRAAVKMATF